MWSRTLSALAFLPLFASCGTPVVRVVQPPAPPAWAMQACQPWPALAGSGRVMLPDLAAAVAAAIEAHADCAARLEGLQGYVRDVVRPEDDQ